MDFRALAEPPTRQREDPTVFKLTARARRSSQGRPRGPRNLRKEGLEAGFTPYPDCL
jgi:hypothetical protein